jgi:hypothetical protein
MELARRIGVIVETFTHACTGRSRWLDRGASGDARPGDVAAAEVTALFLPVHGVSVFSPPPSEAQKPPYGPTGRCSWPFHHRDPRVVIAAVHVTSSHSGRWAVVTSRSRCVGVTTLAR